MNRKAIISALALSTLIPLLLTSCTPTPEPTQPTTPSEPSSSLPNSLEDMTIQDIYDQITFLEWPTEARVGEYITVRLKIGSYEFWDWIRQELVDRGEYDSIWLDPFFTLYMSGEGSCIA